MSRGKYGRYSKVRIPKQFHMFFSLWVVQEWGNPQIMWVLISFSMVESQFWASSCFQMDSFEGKSRGNSVFPLKYQGFLQLFPQTNANFWTNPRALQLSKFAKSQFPSPSPAVLKWLGQRLEDHTTGGPQFVGFA
jgi:hypothetical protein